MKLPGQDNEHFQLFTPVTVVRELPLAKGGGVATAGQTITQADMKAAHETGALLWENGRGGTERFYPVVVRSVALNIPKDDGAGGVVYELAEAPELPDEFANLNLRYFPSDGGRAGRGLCLEDGTSFAAHLKSQGADPDEGNIPAAPVKAAPKAPVMTMPKKPLALAAKAPVAAAVAAPAAKPALAPAKAPLALAKPALAAPKAPVAAPATAALPAKKPLVLKR